MNYIILYRFPNLSKDVNVIGKITKFVKEVYCSIQQSGTVAIIIAKMIQTATI